MESMFLFGSGLNFKKVQSGQASLSAVSTTVAITAVDLNKCILVFSNSFAGATPATPARTAVRGKFNSNIQLGFYTGLYGNPQTIEWAIYEFTGGASIQRGEVAMTYNNGELSVVVSAYKTDKHLLFFSFSSDSDNAGAPAMLVKSRPIDTTHIGFDGNSGYVSDIATIYYQLISL